MPEQIKTLSQRITELEEWLKHNHENPLRTCVESDLRNLKDQLSLVVSSYTQTGFAYDLQK